VIHGGGNDSKFITVKRSKRHLDGKPARKVSVPFPPLSPKSRGSEENFVDPFGLSLISAEVNPVTYARTKQSVRQHTAGGSGVGIRGGNFSPRKVAAKAAGPKKSPPLKSHRAPRALDDDGWETRSDGSGSGDEGGIRQSPPASRVSPVPAPKTVGPPVSGDVCGRFNGRIHATGDDGSCGAHALLAALQHLVRARGVNLVLPEGPEELREVLVEDIRENLDVVGDEFPFSLRTLITDEYLMPVSVAGARQHLHNPDLLATTGCGPSMSLNTNNENKQSEM
jgi:hypothetical protein